MKRACILAFVSALMLSGSTTAEANDGLHGGLPWFGYGYSGSLYGLGRVPVPPYYALHPPVYYSQPVARPYGHSPYAWTSPQADLLNTPAPQLTINPFFKPEVKKPAAEDSRTARAIVNRYFLASEQSAAE